MVLFQDGEFQNAPEKPLRISGEQSKVMVSTMKKIYMKSSMLLFVINLMVLM